ncbi:DNA methyltransferase [Paenirhodobacter sp.]|uniref:DNA methyltransferase n=1 Tax=Paenirhodobacter sp. TaxID=1965326 RepID=UPI003B50E9C4
MNRHMNTPADNVEVPNPFRQVRERLNLTEKELAERLGTSFYAVVRWERGDSAPPEDIIDALDNLIAAKGTAKSLREAPRSPQVRFASTGARKKTAPLPLFDEEKTKFLDEARNDVLADVFDGVFWGDGEIALSSLLAAHEDPAETTDSAVEKEISAGKNTYTYDAHTYHTKVPPQGIASVISSYLPSGGLVLDPFAGSGMTGVAARYVGCDVILNELSPAASFISYNFCRTMDVGSFHTAIATILDRLAPLRRTLYQTQCRECGIDVEAQFFVWSYILECNHCHEDFVLWDHCRKYGKTVREHKLLKKFPCPHCGEEVNKSYLKRKQQVPVFLGYKCCSKKIVEHPLNEEDLGRINQIQSMLTEWEGTYPNLPLPDGVNLGQPKRHGLDSIDKFYTARNLIANAAIWKEIRKIEDSDTAMAAAFAFTSLYQRVTRMSEYRFWGGSGNTANFNVPQISNEANVFITFERKAKSISDHFVTTASAYSGKASVVTGSATDMSFLPDNSVDLIFTDPPFGANINYSEMNILWESWLGKFTNAAHEAIVNKSQKKDIDDYRELMRKALSEAYRVLRDGHWMILVFMNSSEKVWDALRAAVVDAGFAIEKVSVFDKQHGTFKQFVSENTAGSDLMLHCRKSNAPTRVQTASREPLDVGTFIQGHSGNIPVLPFLHVKRDAEIDYRLLYSRYLADAIKAEQGVVSFSSFREQAAEILG